MSQRNNTTEWWNRPKSVRTIETVLATFLAKLGICYAQMSGVKILASRPFRQNTPVYCAQCPINQLTKSLEEDAEVRVVYDDANQTVQVSLTCRIKFVDADEYDGSRQYFTVAIASFTVSPDSLTLDKMTVNHNWAEGEGIKLGEDIGDLQVWDLDVWAQCFGTGD